MRINPIGQSSVIGSMPLSLATAPGGGYAVVLLGGWREQGIQVVESATGNVTQTLLQHDAFVGLVFSPDGHDIYVSGGDGDIVYRYAWDGGAAHLVDSLPLARPDSQAPRYAAGIAVARDGKTLYVAENLSDSLSVIDIASHHVIQRLATGRYPYGVAVAPNGTVYVSDWGANTVSVFSARGNDSLATRRSVAIARHPSALQLNGDGSRLFVASGSTDRVAVLDTRTDAIVGLLIDTPPRASGEGSTPNALALASDGMTLYVAEADNNAIAVFSLSGSTAGVPSLLSADRLTGRVAVGWYPTGVAAVDGQLLVINGKGLGTGPNPDGLSPNRPLVAGVRWYTLGQTTGTFMRIPVRELSGHALTRHSADVAQLNRWDTTSTRRAAYPPFEHVIYVIKENRTYDQMLGDLPTGDGDTSLTFFPRPVSPNHHALAERFGVFDRFFTNAEVSADGHNWSTAAYVSDYAEKTIPSVYSNHSRWYDYEGTNRDQVPGPNEDDVNEPANGYLWNLAERAGISFRNYGEFVLPADKRPGGSADTAWVGIKPFLKTHTNPLYPGFDVDITDQQRIEVWLEEFARYVRAGTLPALEIIRLPDDHTAGTAAGKRTPSACVANNDYALGRMVEALSASPYWKNTVIFVVEDDAQAGADHVDSHRAPFFVISAYNSRGVYHRWTNTTDVVTSIDDILHLGRLSQFDTFGRPLSDVFSGTADTSRYTALRPDIALSAVNPAKTRGAIESERLDLSAEDRADETLFNHILWRAIKGADVPYPAITHAHPIELKRSR